MWSGPRNISTAMMRSFENRVDTDVVDEPFYAYYLKKTGLKHPMYKEIIAKYESDYNRIIHHITSDTNKIVFIKHMTQHINLDSDLSWINNGKNIFLLRDPIKVISSYSSMTYEIRKFFLKYCTKKEVGDFVTARFYDMIE